MKSRRRFIQAAALLSARSCLATDPFNRPDIDASKLPGKWTASMGNVHQTITFNADGTFEGTCRTGDKITDRYAGEWKVKMPYLSAPEFVWKYLKSDQIAQGRVDCDGLETLNSKLLILWTAGGTRRVYRRIHEQ